MPRSSGRRYGRSVPTGVSIVRYCPYNVPQPASRGFTLIRQHPSAAEARGGSAEENGACICNLILPPCSSPMLVFGSGPSVIVHHTLDAVAEMPDVKVYQRADRPTLSSEVRQKLCLVNLSHSRNSFCFNYEKVLDQDIDTVALINC